MLLRGVNKMKLKNSWSVSNKSMAIISSFLLASFLIGFVIFIGTTPRVAANGDGECTEGETQPCGQGICEGNRTCTDGTWGACGSQDNECSRTTNCGDPSSCNGWAYYAVCDADGYCGSEDNVDTDDDSGCAERVCGECDPGPDCALDEFLYTLDVYVSGVKTCTGEGLCGIETCEYDHFCSDDDYFDGSPYTYSCLDSKCDGYGDECSSYCIVDVYYAGSCNVWPGDCACSYESQDCNELDGSYCVGDDREERDYGCGEGCVPEITATEDCNVFDEDNCWCEVDNRKYLYEKCDDWTCGGGACEDSEDDWDRNSETCGKEFECNQTTFCTDYTCYKSNSNRWTWGTPETKETLCTDGDDNDCDGLIDCEDPDCENIPPETTKTYGDPRYPEELVEDQYPHWISSETSIELTAVDPEGVCPASDVKKTYWTITLVDDRYCEDYADCQENATGSEQFNEYEEPFNETETSCHLIEYYSVDNSDNEEEHQKQCVFVDNTGPNVETDNKVGEPKEKWDGKNSKYYPEIEDLCWNDQGDEIECWKVIQETPITLDCVDSDPHPVGVKELCFKVDLDGNDATEYYCDEYSGDYDRYGDGFCCLDGMIEEFHFEEDSEHELEVYCIDELDNIGPIDIEKFKVQGEEFEIELNQKWNLISVPFTLLSGNPDDVFEDIKEEVLLVLTYDIEDPDCVANDGWCIYIPNPGVGTIGEIKPGWGYWVLTNLTEEYTILTVAGSLMSEGESFPSRSVVEGWNLVGYYGTEEGGVTGYDGPDGEGKQAFCALHSLVNEYNEQTWDALITYWYDFIELSECDYIDPGAGYWVGMNVPDPDYRYSNICTGNLCPE